MYQVLLALHLAAAGLTTVLEFIAGFWLVRGADVSKYHHQATNLATMGMVTMATGTLLAVVSARVSAASLCSNVAIYLGLLIVVESLLYFKMVSLRQPFPAQATISRLALGVAPFALALFARV